jgi:NADH-quinone oxidoreductase subunit C
MGGAVAEAQQGVNPAEHPATARLRAALGADPLEAAAFRGQWEARVPRGRVLECLRLLRDDPDLGYEMLCDVTASDHPDAPERFRVAWNLISFRRKDRFRLIATAPEGDPTVPSAVPLFATANWLERECYDMFGVRFSGHPDLRRILMPEGFDAFPLRKEFPMEGERSDRDWARWVLERARRPEGDPM